MMGRRQILKGGDEWDVVCSKPIHKYLHRGGASGEIKRRMNKRARRERQERTQERLETALEDNNMILRGTRILNPIS